MTRTRPGPALRLELQQVKSEKRRCDCENSFCKVGHQFGGCAAPATVKVTHGKLCSACANYMPAKYFLPSDDFVGDAA
jgi:hypothetical protein